MRAISAFAIYCLLAGAVYTLNDLADVEADRRQARGLNVAASAVTSDYWQGDEAKWQETFLAGPGASHVSEIEEDESTQTFQVQVSLPVVDGGSPIGAITLGVDIERLD